MTERRGTDARHITEKQIIQLPLSQAFHICLSNLRIRFGRALITGSGIILGIGFLASVITSANIIKGSGAEWDRADQVHQLWLISLSLLVCTVGIANSMLMAVTERFKEIGTMKCLGALDSLVVKLFLLESGLLGAVGSLTGVIIGFVFAVTYEALSIKGSVWAAINWPSLLFYYLMAVLTGMLLSVVATVYPAYCAAKLPPAAALRTEV